MRARTGCAGTSSGPKAAGRSPQTGRTLRQRLVLASGVANLNLVQTNRIHNFRFGVNEARAIVGTELLPSTDPLLAQSLITVTGPVTVSGLPGGLLTSLPTASLGGF